MEAIRCPLCQPDGVSGYRQAWAEVYYDGRVTIDCPDCGRFSLKHAGHIAKFAFNPLSEEELANTRRLIKSENKMRMIPRLDHQRLSV